MWFILSVFRYFDCKPLHGLFAPVHKVTRLAGAMSLSTPSPMSRSLGSGLRSARERSGSQESVSSISSSASSVSRSRVRLGVTSLASQVHAATLVRVFLYIVRVLLSFFFSFSHSVSSFRPIGMWFLRQALTETPGYCLEWWKYQKSSNNQDENPQTEELVRTW